ncbi:MAG: mechanosensitive ion channel, partial [Flavobacterium sp.]
NQTIFIPNGILSNGTIINYSMEKIRKAELTLAISYATDIRIAKEIILKIMKENPKVLKKPEPVVAVRELTPQSILLAIRPWSKNEDFGEMTSDVLQECKAAFDAAGISIQPYNVELSKQ